MIILLTGAGGFCGEKMREFFSLKNKNKLFCITRKKLKNKKIKFIKIDLSKKLKGKILHIKRVDYVIHTAFTKMKKNLSHSRILKNNIQITKNLILILKNVKFKKLINLSSSSVYPNISGKFSENSKLNFYANTDFSYALSKFVTEIYFNLSFEKKKILHLRIGQIMGNDRDKSIISNFKNSIKKKNIIEIYGNGMRTINLIHIDKLIYYISLIVKKNICGTYNICDYSINLKDVAKFIANKYGDNKTKIKYKKIFPDNPKFILDTKKFFNDINLLKPKIKNLKYEI